jgi:prepilin-type processing-associated H-X9-DG protein
MVQSDCPGLIKEGYLTVVAGKKVKKYSSFVDLGDTITAAKPYSQIGSMYFTSSSYHIHMRHSRKTNISFLDGHAASCLPAEVLDAENIMYNNLVNKILWYVNTPGIKLAIQ